MKGLPEYYELLHATTMFAFEYSRLKLSSKEQELLEEYIEKQYIPDEELQAKLDEFNAELARAAGVEEDEILNSVEDIDEFFI